MLIYGSMIGLWYLKIVLKTILHEKNNFAEASKNLFKFENNLLPK